MKIKFLGAAGRVTGSCHMLIVNGRKVLLDCGLFQGKDESVIGNERFNFNPKEIEFVILSHAHIDHSGRIPLLYKQGFKGQVICTEGTNDLCKVMLPDSGYVQETEIEWKNKRRRRQGLAAIEPLYTAKIAQLSTYLFTGFPYDEIIEVFPGLKVRFKDAGHLLGSAIVELFIKEEGKEEIKIVFSGDLGHKDIPLIKNPTNIDYADYVIMETTYGNRYHSPIDKELQQLVKIIKETFRNGGNVVIPSFAVGRTQEVLYALNNYIESNLLNNIKVYVDSPLASEATSIFKDYEEYYDDTARKLIEEGKHPLDFKGLMFTKTLGDSMAVNKIQNSAIIISASGMCEAGRIKHHLKHNLWREECSIVFVGYQAEGTLGRAILDGNKKVNILGEEIAINAKIYNLPGLSGHADREGLYSWLKAFKKKPKEVVLVHGDVEERESFNELLKSNNYKTRMVNLGESFIINENHINDTTLKQRIINFLEDYEEVNEINKMVVLDKIKDIITED